MTNQHAGLSQVLAEQRRTQLREQAAHARLLRAARPPRRQRRRWAARGWWRLDRWPGAAARRPSQSPSWQQLTNRRQPCPNSHAHSSSGPRWPP
jgi:hypothetical protein